MPVKSAKQFRLMQAAKMGGVGGVAPDVANEMLSKTPHSVKSGFASSKRPSNLPGNKKKMPKKFKAF
jgi:hypothetical protein